MKCKFLSYTLYLLYELYISPLSEQEILREEITCLQSSKERLKKRVSELEEEVKKYKEELDKALKRASAQPDDEVCLIDR